MAGGHPIPFQRVNNPRLLGITNQWNLAVDPLGDCHLSEAVYKIQVKPKEWGK